MHIPKKCCTFAGKIVNNYPTVADVSGRTTGSSPIPKRERKVSGSCTREWQYKVMDSKTPDSKADPSKSGLEYTERGWRNTLDSKRHHRERNWDYKGRGIYHFTLTTCERYPLFGKLAGKSPEEAYVDLNEFGYEVLDILLRTPRIYSHKGYAIRILASQIMPDHIHLVLHVIEPIPRSVGFIIRGFKSTCSAAYKRMYVTGDNDVTQVHRAFLADKDIVHFARIFASSGSIWENIPSHYHERILHHDGQLDAMIRYVKANPRRLALKRANPDLFRIHQQTQIAGVSCTTLGNMFLAERPFRAVLQCSRKLTQAEIETRKDECLEDAANGTVFITAAVSDGEKQIARALRETGYPLIILLEKGFPKPEDPHYAFFKPSGVYFEACATGKLLLVEPHPDLFELPDVVAQVTAKTGDIPHDTLRYRFVALNVIASLLAPSL